MTVLIDNKINIWPGGKGQGVGYFAASISDLDDKLLNDNYITTRYSYSDHRGYLLSNIENQKIISLYQDTHTPLYFEVVADINADPVTVCTVVEKILGITVYVYPPDEIRT